MHYLIVDTRFPVPVHVFLEHDPRSEPGFPRLVVRRVTLESPGDGAEGNPSSVGPAAAVGQNPYRSDRFRAFPSDGAATRAGFGVIEPRFVGATWGAYHRAFGFGSRTLPRHG